MRTGEEAINRGFAKRLQQMSEERARAAAYRFAAWVAAGDGSPIEAELGPSCTARALCFGQRMWYERLGRVDVGRDGQGRLLFAVGGGRRGVPRPRREKQAPSAFATIACRRFASLQSPGGRRGGDRGVPGRIASVVEVASLSPGSRPRASGGMTS